MSDELRHRTVAVAVIDDQASGKYLLWHNKRWHGYAFPMRHFEPGEPDRPAQAALDALAERDFPLDLPRASASPLDFAGECLFSEGVRQYTYYDYHVHGVDPGTSIAADSLDPDLRFFTYEELVAAPNVTSSTKLIARSLVEDRKVAAAVITRMAKRGREFLLVCNKHYRYFFPATRIKTEAHPAEAAVRAVRIDAGYDGEARVMDQVQVDALQESRRFGSRQTRFHFHLCLVDLPAVNLDAEGNRLEESLDALQAALKRLAFPATSSKYWGWFTEEEMKTDKGMSPSTKIVLATAAQLVEQRTSTYRPKPISTSHVALSAEIVALTEKLAENTHDHWAEQRIADGWQYGRERSDQEKTNPCLVPYADLPESEKRYDRQTAMETLKAIVALGYRIQRDSSE